MMIREEQRHLWVEIKEKSLSVMAAWEEISKI
jgi:hypothetical protein